MKDCRWSFGEDCSLVSSKMDEGPSATFAFLDIAVSCLSKSLFPFGCFCEAPDTVAMAGTPPCRCPVMLSLMHAYDTNV